MVSAHELRTIGAKKVLKEAAAVQKDESLLLLVDESLLPIGNYFVLAARKLDLENITLVIIPRVFRPMRVIPVLIAEAIQKVDAMIYVIDRMPEDSGLVYGREIWGLAKKSGCRYLTMHDPKPEYFEKGGVIADYDEVERKGAKVAAMLHGSVGVEIKSELGSNASFSFDLKVNTTYRSPSFKYRRNIDNGMVQIPEGEATRTPLTRSATGRIVIDGAITGLGVPPKPIEITFKDGKNISVEGDSFFLGEMLDYARRQGAKLESLTQMDTITEFSVGFNDWALFDNNISNCEKVSGGVHLGLGTRGIEWFDNILTKPSVTLVDSKGARSTLIENGKLQV